MIERRRTTTTLLLIAAAVAALLLFNLNGCTAPNLDGIFSNGSPEQTSQKNLPVEGGQGQGRAPRIQGNKPQGVRPLPTQNLVNNEDPAQTCDRVWAEEGGPRNIFTDAVTIHDNRMGPNAWGNSRDSVLRDFVRAMCLSRTVLHDIEGLLKAGYGWTEPESERVEHILETDYTLDASRADWSRRVYTARHWLEIRFVRFQHVSESNSWFYGDKSGPVPPLMKDRKARPSVIFVINVDEFGNVQGIDLECIQGGDAEEQHFR